jgi:hypothetical protein
LFSKAIELDADFALAYGMAVWCYVWRKINGWITDRVQEIAERAIQVTELFGQVEDGDL